ncbi:hypothetical protein MAR_008099 [Mya arenaria]|uniref:4Fe-4S ferredoxin-type domain-containing protein n=1 Tax=Mya arenaria TaxID=6604 RepID=A0ABY7E308_MYAAR|nr:hypothetical protein MAR_008099 [Mya arenaria]
MLPKRGVINLGMFTSRFTVIMLLVLYMLISRYVEATAGSCDLCPTGVCDSRGTCLKICEDDMKFNDGECVGPCDVTCSGATCPGPNCVTCQGNMCITCRPGFYGARCDQVCTTTCKINGECHKTEGVCLLSNEISCGDRHRLDGNAKITCKPDATWSDLPSCSDGETWHIITASIVIAFVMLMVLGIIVIGRLSRLSEKRRKKAEAIAIEETIELT